MRAPFCLFCMILLFVLPSVHGQKDSTFRIKGNVKIAPAKTVLSSVTVPFSGIEVADCRIDTSKLGYAFGDWGIKMLIPANTLSGDITDFLTSFYKNRLDPSAPYTLFIAIKNLWLQDASIAELENTTVIYREDVAIKRFGVCTAKLEVYARQGNLFKPFFRLDTSFQANKLLLKEASVLLAQPFAACMEKAVILPLKSGKLSEKQLTWKDIRDYNDKRLAFPRFQYDTFGRGIYRTFSDFLNNRPDTTTFEIKSGRMFDELYTLENAGKTLQDKVWGFCDGKKHYVRLGRNFYELQRTGNTYEFWGSKYVMERRSVRGGTSSYPPRLIEMVYFNENRRRAYKRMQLDMETGKAF